MVSKNFFAFCGALAISALLASCGGGGGGSSEGSSNQNVTPSASYTGTYTGAASVGDFATYTVNGNTISYQIKGYHFSNGKTGSFKIVPAFNNSNGNTHYWKSEDENVAVFLSENIGMAFVKDNNSYFPVIGLREVSNIQSIIGKTFVYIDISNNYGLNGCEVTINNNNTFSLSCLNGTQTNGCWYIDTNNNKMIVTDDNAVVSNGCSNWDGSISGNLANYYNIVAKPSSNGRAGFVVDHMDGTGIGIGIEKIAYNDLTQEVGTDTLEFETLGVYQTEACYATVSVYNCTQNQCEYKWTPHVCIDLSRNEPNPSQEETGTLERNCYYDNSGSKVSYDGVLCAQNSNGGQYNVMFDKQSKMYIAIRTIQGNTAIEIGAVK